MNHMNHMKKGGRDIFEGLSMGGPGFVRAMDGKRTKHFQNAFERWPRRSAALPKPGALLKEGN